MFEGLEPWLRPYAIWLYQVAQLNGLQPRITSVFRSFEQQAMLRQRWERGESELYAAKPGESYHNYGRAFDMVTRDNDALGNLWKRMGGQWWPTDYVHFQA